MTELLLVSAAAIGSLMLTTWLVSLVVDDVSIVDIVWGLGFVFATWAAYLTASEHAVRGLLVAILVSIWGLRLSGYLAWRNIGKGEDRRYQRMRKKNPDSFWLTSLLTVFGLQAAIMWVVAIPALASQTSAGRLFWIDYLGIGIWLVGLSFEAVGDFQLARFKARPESKGKVMDHGLWRYTRHPNYFGDFCVWWGIYVIAVAGGAWWTVFSPLLMSALLMRFSGVGLLESTITRRRPEYSEYIRTTNAFFPGPSRRTTQTGSEPGPSPRPSQ